MLIYAFVAALAVSLLSLTGVFLFGKRGSLLGTHRYILPAAVGIFLGVVFFELIPETIEANHELGAIAIAVGFLGFYLLSFVLDTFHHHHRSHDDHCVGSGARKLLIGDTIHNVADGVIIATSFMVSPPLGIVTTLGIALHEVPQEIAEFGVLLHSGYTRRKAAFLNSLSAISVVGGVLLTYLFVDVFENYLFVLTGIAAGNLLYIASSDLIPELRESHKTHFWQTFLSTILGLVFIFTLLSFTHAEV